MNKNIKIVKSCCPIKTEISCDLKTSFNTATDKKKRFLTRAQDDFLCKLDLKMDLYFEPLLGSIVVRILFFFQKNVLRPREHFEYLFLRD